MEKVSESRIRLETILRLPLFLSELSVVVGLVILVTLGTGDVKVLVGVFAVASFRLLPALRAILGGWTQIQNALCSLNVIEDGLSGYVPSDAIASHAAVFDKSIQISKLSYSYPNGEQVFDNFDCIIHKGEYVGFQGYSGAGKSTLFNLLLGLLKPSSGEIQIDGQVLTADRQMSWMRQIGYVPQEVFIFQGSLAENIALGSNEIDTSRIHQVLQQVCLDTWLTTLPNGVDTSLGEAGSRLSGGQKQRIGIARALYKQPEVLLLDEATSALDNVTEKEINETLCRLKQDYPGLTVLSIAHRESSLAYCDRIITIENNDV